MLRRAPSFSRAPAAWLLGGASAVLAVAGCGAPDSVDLESFPNRLELAAESSAVPFETRSEWRLVDFGAGETRALLGDGWAVGEGFESQDGDTFLWGLGEGSTMELLLLEARDLEATARVSPYRWPASPRQTVTVEANGREVARFRLKPGAREYSFTFPEEALVAGINQVRWRYAYSGVPAEVDESASDRRPLAVAWDFLRLGRGTERPAPPQGGDGDLRLAAGTEVSYYLTLPAASVLTFDAVEQRGRLVVEVAFDGAEQVVRREWKTPRKDAAAVELANRGDQLARITFRARPDDTQDGGAAALVVRRPSVRTVEPLRVAAAAPAAKPAAAKPNVLLYLVDTLRADHLGAYGYAKPVSPHVDAFARDAVLFERTLANSSWTRSAMSSVMTGLLPSKHGVHGRKDRLATEAVTLAELLSAAGYTTAAFVTNISVTQISGLDEGFDDFRYFEPEHAYVRSDVVNGEIFSWLSERPREKPFFVWVHSLDPHAPYAAPPPFAPDGIETPALTGEAQEVLDFEVAKISQRFGDGPDLARLGSAPWLRTLSRNVVPVDRGLVEDMNALYDAEIAFNDHTFGALLDRLREEGLADSTVVVFLSDHGEEFYEHGGWSHGKTLYQEVLEVPWIVRFPESSGMPRGVRVAEMAQQVDVLPTLADYLGLPLAEPVDGRSLLPAILGGEEDPSRPRQSYAHLDLDEQRAASLVEGRFKILCPELTDCRLYDLEEDPAESTDVGERYPVRLGYLRASLGTFYGTSVALAAPQMTIDAETRKRLEALGYL